LERKTMDEFDETIRKHLDRERADRKERELLGHLEESESEKVPPALVRRAQALKAAPGIAVCPHCGKSITPFKKPLAGQRVRNGLELGVSLLFFGLSFAFRHYFAQFLIVAVLAGIQWIVDRKATKTQILIYKALREEPGEASPANRIRAAKTE
jgi:hypothetical protein